MYVLFVKIFIANLSKSFNKKRTNYSLTHAQNSNDNLTLDAQPTLTKSTIIIDNSCNLFFLSFYLHK